MHTHEHMISRIIFLGGKMVFYKGLGARDLSWRRLFRSFTIAKGQTHGAIALPPFGLFLNFETWDREPTSAAHDLILS